MFPQEWQRAVEFDRAVRDMSSLGIRSPVYLHRSRQPLELVQFTGGQVPAGDGFANECGGLCGL